MMTLKNHELDQKLKRLAKQEREHLREVIEHIHEAEVRGLYLDFEFPSLFAYLVKSCGFSTGGAQRRIDAARLLAAEPKLGEKIESGEINLGQITILQKTIREKNKTHKVTNEEKKNLIEKIANKSTQDTQKIIAQELDIKIKQRTNETAQKDGSVRLEVTFSKEDWEILKKARDLTSNATHTNEWSEVINTWPQKQFAKKKDPPPPWQ